MINELIKKYEDKINYWECEKRTALHFFPRGGKTRHTQALLNIKLYEEILQDLKELKEKISREEVAYACDDIKSIYFQGRNQVIQEIIGTNKE